MPTLPSSSGKRPWQPARKPYERPAYTTHANKSPLYNTRRWQASRLAQLKREPCCRRCASMGLTVPATVCDHVVRVNDGADFWDSSNYASLCASCHARKSAKESHIDRKKGKNSL